MSDWFYSHRQEWIAETVRIFGFINREHIEKKFGISTPQASIDIQRFIDANPGVLKYNKSTKRYEYVEQPEPPCCKGLAPKWDCRCEKERVA